MSKASFFVFRLVWAFLSSGAVCCAIQNIQLAAWAEGMGMQWSTGRVVQLPQTSELLNVDRAHEELVGLLYFGYPATTPAPPARKPLAEVMQHLP